MANSVQDPVRTMPARALGIRSEGVKTSESDLFCTTSLQPGGACTSFTGRVEAGSAAGAAIRLISIGLIATYLSACAASSTYPARTAPPAFARRLPPPPGLDEVVLTGGIEGRLVQSGDCLRLVTRGANSVPVWTHTTSLVEQHGRFVIVDSRTGSRVKVGDRIKASGGAASPLVLRHVTDPDRVAGCGGPYLLIDAFVAV